MFEDVVAAALLVTAAPLLVAASYLSVLSLAAVGYAPRTRQQRSSGRLTVVVPAHNEAALIARCVKSLTAQTYAPEQVVVVADNCDDATASEALAAGALVMVRNDKTRPGKGRALRWSMDELLAAPDAPDGIVVVDADSVADPDLLEGLAGALAAGAEAAQADYTVLGEEEAGRGDQLRALAVLLYNRTRNRGRERLGLPASLLGNGMMLSASLLRRHPWAAFSAVEDLEFATQCRIMGVRPVFAGGHGVKGPLPHGYRAGIGQRMRWEGGRFHVLRKLGPTLAKRLLHHPDLGTIDAILELAVPPLWIVFLLAVAGGLVSAAAAVIDPRLAPSAAVWAACVGLVSLHVLVGLRAGDAPWRSYRMLLGLPGFVLWKLGVYGRLLQGFDPNRWQRSVRRGEV